MAILISEIMYHPVEEGGVPAGDETLEFIELYNNRAVFEDLSGYAFTNGVDYVFPEGTILGEKEHLVIARDPDAVEAAYGITGVLGPFAGKLNNNGERIELSNANDEIIISIRYNDSRPWPSTTDGTGHTLILSKPGFDPEEGSSWSASTYIGGTPGKADIVQVDPVGPQLVTLIDLGHPGSYFKGTKEPSPGTGGEPTAIWTQIGFTENSDWLNGPSGYGYSNDSSELQYVGTVLDDMRHGYISIYARLHFTLTQKQIDSFTQLSGEVNYDDNYILYLNGVRVSASNGVVDDPPPFSQGAGSASDYPTAYIDLTGRLNLLNAGDNVLSIQVHNASIGDSSDCIASAVLRAVMEEGSISGDDPRACVLINELLTNSDLPPGTDWLELYNPGPVAVDLSNVYISEGRFDLLQYKIPDGIMLQPGEFWAVHQGTPPNAFPFGLGFGGETVFLTAATDDYEPNPIRILDAVRFGTVEADVTIGRYPNGSESIGALSTPTFEGHNARPLIRDIVINEIMYHHGTRDDRYEFIELFNRGSATVDLSGWSFEDGIAFVFPQGTQMAVGSYLVVAMDSAFLAGVYDNLTIGVNLIGDYTGKLNHHSERIRLSYPIIEINSATGLDETYWVTVDEVTYYDGGRWPKWADGEGSSMELRDPHSENNSPDAWADSDESSKAVWEQFSFTIDNNDSQYTHDNVNIFSLIMLNRGEVLIDDLELIIDGSQKLTNNGFESIFESGLSGWRHLGNHVQSFATTEDKHSGSNALHLVATGHGDPGANRINQSLTSVRAGTVTFRGWAKRLKGTRHMLLRLTRELAPVQPPRPSHAFELNMPVNQGTPGGQNTAYVANRGPDINKVKHSPVMPTDGESIVVTATVGDNNGVDAVTLRYRSEGASTFDSADMVDDGSGNDVIAGDSIFTATIPGASAGTMRAFYIEASDGSSQTRFPTRLQDSADVPDRTCMVRVGDSLLSTNFATYR
ncbi:MAG: lamin tail domain-containing protein, partial [Anaerohalosphaera sp.]|nr:lamin tail domain-containing protein [Anaerohalosphaera sp.]